MGSRTLARQRQIAGAILVVVLVAGALWVWSPGLPVFFGPSASDKDIAAGRELFEHEWQPNDPKAHGDGLGPVFNARSCAELPFPGRARRRRRIGAQRDELRGAAAARRRRVSHRYTAQLQHRTVPARNSCRPQANLSARAGTLGRPRALPHDDSRIQSGADADGAGDRTLRRRLDRLDLRQSDPPCRA